MPGKSKKFPLFGVGQEGLSPVITSQTHINLLADIRKDAEKSKIAFIGTCGQTLFSDENGDTPIRGWIAIGSLIYFVHRGTFYEMNNAGVRTSRGTLSTVAGRVDLAYDGTVIMLVDGTAGYTYTIASTTFAVIVDAQFPNGVTTCTWLSAQFVVGGDGTDVFWISPDGSAWDANDFGTAESNPDGIVRVFADNGQLILFGENTTEFWGVTTADFPFAPIQGATQSFGLAARWSVAHYNSGIAALMKPPGGQVQVMFCQGYVFKPLSDTDMDALISAYATKSDAVAFSYNDRGHVLYQINFPSAMASWLFDSNSGMFTSKQYGLNGERDRAELQLDFLNRTFVSDYSDGNIYILEPDVYTDNGTQIAREIIGRQILDANNRFIIDQLYVDMETGVGATSGQGSDPQAMLQWSKDGGRTWSAEMWTTIGELGQYLTRVVWRRLGLARDFIYRIRITDPIKVVMTYGAIMARQ